MANEAVEAGRKSIKNGLSKAEANALKNDRFLMLKRWRDLSGLDEFRLSGWTENYPLLQALYLAKEEFFDIWDSGMSRHQAELAYTHWKNSLPVDIAPYFSDLERAVSNWHHEVFNYFDCRVTNAYTESINNQIKAIARQGRGYSFNVLRAKVLYIHTLHVKKTSFKSSIPDGALGKMGLSEFEELNYGVRIL